VRKEGRKKGGRKEGVRREGGREEGSLRVPGREEEMNFWMRLCWDASQLKIHILFTHTWLTGIGYRRH
jgi:hypothetical protein